MEDESELRSEQRRRSSSAKESLNVEKWRLMIVNWNKLCAESPNLVKNRIRQGVPDILRGFMWQIFANVQEYKKNHLDVYQQLVGQTHVPFEDDIMRDISRTFPKQIFFRERHGFGQTSMLRVLKAYSLYNSEVGYCQGMGFITGLLLLYMSEEDCFWMLSSLMDKYRMEGLLKPGLPYLKQYFYQFEQLVKHFFPKLYNHLKVENVNADMYASQWFMTVYSYNFPFAVVSRVWDIFLAEGVKIVFRIALALLKLKHDEILALSFERILILFKNIPIELDGEQLIETALKLKVSSKMLEDLEVEYRSLDRGGHLL